MARKSHYTFYTRNYAGGSFALSLLYREDPNDSFTDEGEICDGIEVVQETDKVDPTSFTDEVKEHLMREGAARILRDNASQIGRDSKGEDPLDKFASFAADIAMWDSGEITRARTSKGPRLTDAGRIALCNLANMEPAEASAWWAAQSKEGKESTLADPRFEKALAAANKQMADARREVMKGGLDALLGS